MFGLEKEKEREGKKKERKDKAPRIEKRQCDSIDNLTQLSEVKYKRKYVFAKVQKLINISFFSGLIDHAHLRLA